MAKTEGEVLDWAEVKWILQEHAFGEAEYAGVPIPVHDAKVTMAERHPRAKEWDGATLGASEHARPREFACDVSDGGVVVRNQWWSRRLRSPVWIFEDASEPGRIQWVVEPFALQLEPLRRWDLLFRTIAAGQQAWEPAAELRAMATLEGHINRAQMALYVLHGLFIESSTRSQARYVFRKGRPTLVLLPGRSGDLYPSCALCHHPLAYYQGTFAGGMVPTDDVIAALLLMRADEARLWREANQHPLDRLEAGL